MLKRIKKQKKHTEMLGQFTKKEYLCSRYVKQ